MNESVLQTLQYLTWGATSLIVIATIGIVIYIQYIKNNKELSKKRRWVENLPSLISTLGVIGTFAGITVGLIYFDTHNLDNSIPLLLEGLKTAFFTSLAGMLGSLILTRQINKYLDDEEGGVSDINQAASVISKSISDLQTASAIQAQNQTIFYNTVQNLVQKIETDISSMVISANNLNIAANNIAIQLQSVAESDADIKNRMENVDNSVSSIVTSVGNVEETSKRNIEISSDIKSFVGEMSDHTEAMVSTEGEVSEKVSKLTDKLHSEVVEIEEKMNDTSILLERKFDEFSELLKKNNTEALVEVMKRVTEEFQSQMNALINKLIQDNFDQLNKSVERLNKWQQENKEMIQSLTSQYKQMADNFEDTSTSLNRVKDDTQALVGEGGKLEQLVNSLNEVIINDQKFKEISTNLQQTADLSKSNMESFDQSTRQLNEWVKKQRNFSDAVAVLIQKLEELNEIRNYASTFWKDTKKGMNEAVGIVKDGTNELNRQISGLDQQFYTRLSTTLAQLDACIQSLITNANKR